jgi:hypothetical protein
MKRNAFLTTLLSVSLMLSMLPFMVLPASANNDESTPITIDNYGQHWIRVKTDIITILFPANGKKPMFLWWYSNDTNNVYVVKYKGLIEFLAFDAPYYLRVNQALAERIRERLQAGFIEPKEAMLASQIRDRIRERLLNIATLYDLHPPFLPFSACEWNLTGPVLVPKGGNVYCVSFNFTLTKAPPIFSFAENNVIIRCRFYNGSVEESAGTYNYTVGAGQMKMDLVVKNWTWNIDKLQPLFDELEQYGIHVPPHEAKLALWINLASINIVDLNTAENDIGNPVDNAVETTANVRATASNMVFSGKGHQIMQNDTALGVNEKPISLQYRLGRYFKMHFAKGDEILAGFFSFISTANVIDPETKVATTENVTASYIAAGGHMRLFLCYPYFGNKTLEHDPLIGVEYIPPFVSPVLVLILIVAAGAIGVALAVAKWKRKVVNIVGAD